MSDIIQILPDSVANQIAAGEVIQRPASVIKELVENSLDSGAKNIQVIITDSGKTCMQVIDDGKGMSALDARMAFERHATSKITNAADLFALRTMGFRGEALASIAAVAQVDLISKREEDEVATSLTITGSRLVNQEIVAAGTGSNFSIKNLFFNVPARRKFLKTEATELSKILTEFERVALVNEGVNFSLFSNGTELFNLPETSLRQRIIHLFGKKLNQDLLSVNVDTTLVKIHGFTGKSESSKKRGAHQYFFVNGRYMRHPYFHKAVMDAYKELIPVNDQISYFLYFEVDPSSIDVNIHPTKTEIKFENEQAIWQIISVAVKETLGKFNEVPSIDFDTEGMPDIPIFLGENNSSSGIEVPNITIDSSFNPFKTNSRSSGPVGNGGSYTIPSRGNLVPNDWEKLYEGIERTSKLNAPIDEFALEESLESKGNIVESKATIDLYGNSEDKQNFDEGSSLLQYKGTYLVTPVKSGLMLIDQHRAHIRVLYDKYMEQMKLRKGVSQGVLFPEMIQLPISEAAILDSINEDFAAVGFEITNLGGGSFAINGVPEGIQGLDPTELVYKMLHSAMEEGGDVKSQVQSILALTLARSAAIVYGQVLSISERTKLLDNLFACALPNFTPDGLTILTTISDSDIDKRFEK